MDQPGIEPGLPAYKTGAITIHWSNISISYNFFISIFFDKSNVRVWMNKNLI